MELRVLKYFLMVAREGNITKAARLLHITQPTLSRQLRQLEEELGVKLFQRGQHGIHLTDDGMLLRRRAHEILVLSEKVADELSHGDEFLAGEIVIGSGETKNINTLAKIVADFRKMHPNVRFDIYSAMANDIKERLERGLVDIGVLVEPVDFGQYSFLRLPGKEKAGVLMREDSPLAAKETIGPADLVGTPLLLAKRPYMQREVSSWFEGYTDEMEIAATYNLIYNAAILVKNHMGVAICIDLESEFEGLCFRPLVPERENGVVLVWKKELMLPPVTKAFIEYVKECV